MAVISVSRDFKLLATFYDEKLAIDYAKTLAGGNVMARDYNSGEIKWETPNDEKIRT